ncbi:EF-hand domain-containing protein [Nonomuraea sp. FMUSA5-5]|uniref:EF-hand domain-containing protein n=1 Tax=Nonomuraea composti TaxID=2720023 RepID=A0ABX1AUU6_9ACTN|nr:EF-hand domain-containing protein [Nonomuraea sp. FMUSA5-5]
MRFSRTPRTTSRASPSKHTTVSGTILTIFDACDGDQDGWLTREEFERLYGSTGMRAEATRIAFEHMDVNGNGSVSREEFSSGVDVLPTSTDLSSPGVWMLGRTGRGAEGDHG